MRSSRILHSTEIVSERTQENRIHLILTAPASTIYRHRIHHANFFVYPLANAKRVRIHSCSNNCYPTTLSVLPSHDRPVDPWVYTSWKSRHKRSKTMPNPVEKYESMCQSTFIQTMKTRGSHMELSRVQNQLLPTTVPQF